MPKESKTMLEVWAAKEKLSAELLKMSSDERKAWHIKAHKRAMELMGNKQKAKQ